MDTLQFRMTLFDPTVPRPERPVQAFATNMKVVEDWAAKYLAISGVGSEVWVYKLEETLVGSYKRTI